MRRRKTLFGVLVVARNRSPEFTEDEAELIELFANAATVALENERLVAPSLHRHHVRPIKIPGDRARAISGVYRGVIAEADRVGAEGRQIFQSGKP
jgi:GAF domain-containing protein